MVLHAQRRFMENGKFFRRDCEIAAVEVKRKTLAAAKSKIDSREIGFRKLSRAWMCVCVRQINSIRLDLIRAKADSCVDQNDWTSDRKEKHQHQSTTNSVSFVFDEALILRWFTASTPAWNYNLITKRLALSSWQLTGTSPLIKFTACILTFIHRRFSTRCTICLAESTRFRLFGEWRVIKTEILECMGGTFAYAHHRMCESAGE